MKTDEYRKKISDGLKGHEGVVKKYQVLKSKISESQYIISCPNGEIIKIKNLKNVKDYFENESNSEHSNKIVSLYAILFSSGSKGYVLISKSLEKI